MASRVGILTHAVSLHAIKHYFTKIDKLYPLSRYPRPHLGRFYTASNDKYENEILHRFPALTVHMVFLPPGQRR